MKQIVILSGKGGTGKTTVAGALAHLASREAKIVMVDADVDAANLELLLSPEKRETHEFTGGKLAVIHQDLCTDCGSCSDVCRFDAIHRNGQGFQVDAIGCEGCASCFYRCPAQAITMEERQSGLWFRSDTRFGPLFHAHLFPAAENSGKLVTLLKQRAIELAKAEGCDYLIVDGPPGIGCPVIAACSGSDLALLVAEPTVAGVHDLRRILATVQHFRVPAAVVINKCDLNIVRRREIQSFCDAEGIPIAAQIPFDTEVTKAMIRGRVVTEEPNGEFSRGLVRIWGCLR